MARIFMDGWESKGLGLWDAYSGATVIDARAGHSGSYCLELSVGLDYLQKDIPADDEYYFAMKYEVVNDNNMLGVITLYNAGTILVQVRRETNGYLAVYVGGSKVAEAASKPVFKAGGTRLIEVHVKIHDTEGVAQVKVDGEQVINFSGDTKTGDATQINRVRLGSDDNSYGYAYYDDFIIDDANWIGNTKIQAIVPNGAGSSTQWTASTGDNYACVDERPADDTDYVYTNEADKLDLYTLSALSGSINSIKGVQVQIRHLYEGNPTPKNVKIAIKSNDDIAYSADIAVASAIKESAKIWETDPDTTSAWTESGVNALEAGIKSAA